MIEKLRSHLRKSKGFTLIELLIVIAIIAILVVVVIVAINPAERLRQAADRRASSNVRSVGTSIQACLTNNQETAASCDTIVELTAAPDNYVANAGLLCVAAGCGNGAAPTGVWLSAAAADPIVVCQQGRTSGAVLNYWRWQSDTKTVAATAVVCP